MLVFQFQKGTINTFEKPNLHNHEIKFQFQKGTINTAYISACRIVLLDFNSRKVRLTRVSINHKLFVFVYISIPERYD